MTGPSGNTTAPASGMSAAGEIYRHLWTLNESVLAAALLSAALQHRLQDLHGFLDAAEAGMLPDFDRRMVVHLPVHVDGDVAKLMPDQRGLCGSKGTVLEMPPIEALSLAFAHPDVDESKRMQRDIRELDEAHRGLLQRALDVLHACYRGPQLRQPIGHSPFDRLCAGVLAACRDPWACELVVQRQKDIHQPFHVRTLPHAVNEREMTSLARLALVRANPAAIHAVMSHPDWDVERIPFYGRQHTKPAHEMLDALMGRDDPGCSTTTPDIPQIVGVLADEVHAPGSSPCGLASALARWMDSLSSEDRALAHSRLLVAAMRSCAVDARFEAVERLLLDGCPEPLGPWYEAAAGHCLRQERKWLNRPAETLLPWVVSAAAESGRAHVLACFKDWISSQARQLATSGSPSQDEMKLLQLLFSSCVQMCSKESINISAQAFASTVDVLVSCAMDARRFTDPALCFPGEHKAPLLHELAKQGHERILVPAMLHLVELGCDPAQKGPSGKSLAVAMKAQGLGKEWEAALRSHAVREQALQAVRDIETSVNPVRERP